MATTEETKHRVVTQQSSTSSLSKWLQQPVLDQAKAQYYIQVSHMSAWAQPLTLSMLSQKH